MCQEAIIRGCAAPHIINMLATDELSASTVALNRGIKIEK